MQISIMEISMSLNGNLGLSWGITLPTEKNNNCYKSSKFLYFKTNLKIHFSSSKIRIQFVWFIKFLVTLNLSVWLPCLISFVGGKLSDIYLSLSTVRLIFDTKKNLVNTACWALPKQVFGFVYHQGITQQCFIFCPNSS